MIMWGEKIRPRKADAGHSAVQYGTSGSDRGKTFVRCECGTQLSGRGDEGGYRSHQRHAQREAAKRASAPERAARDRSASLLSEARERVAGMRPEPGIDVLADVLADVDLFLSGLSYYETAEIVAARLTTAGV
jgi:hypothetical protein